MKAVTPCLPGCVAEVPRVSPERAAAAAEPAGVGAGRGTVGDALRAALRAPQQQRPPGTAGGAAGPRRHRQVPQGNRGWGRTGDGDWEVTPGVAPRSHRMGQSLLFGVKPACSGSDQGRVVAQSSELGWDLWV